MSCPHVISAIAPLREFDRNQQRLLTASLVPTLTPDAWRTNTCCVATEVGDYILSNVIVTVGH